MSVEILVLGLIPGKGLVLVLVLVLILGLVLGLNKVYCSLVLHRIG